MAKVKIQGHASGTGVITLTAPNTSTDRTITLPDATGTLLNSDGDGSNLTGISSVTTLNGLTDVSMDITNLTNGLIIQTNRDGSAPTTGTLNNASGILGIGENVFAALTEGDDNIALGNNTLMALTTGDNNIAIGSNAGTAITTANNNTAVGVSALTLNTTGANNTAVGYKSLRDCVTGGQNAALGYYALINTTASNNTAVGNQAVQENTSGTANVAVGYESLKANTTASFNTAVGNECLIDNTTGTGNVGVGHRALWNNTTGSNNTGVGIYALDTCTTGQRNSGFGYYAGHAITTAEDNVAVGFAALHNNQTGDENIAVGYAALYDCTGANNIAIGYDSGRANSPGGNITSGSNRIVLGNNNHTSSYIKVDWTVTSDERDKMNFEEVPHGLSFVNDLQPVKFDFKKSRENATPHGKTKYGFKAQDILALEGDNPIIIDNENEDSLSITNSHLIPILVKAIQELSAKVTALESE